ncbi:hypothetical protein IFM89_028669 [Coptis chinensis]|uniref:Uncharacterized protein n=1 Tax=Coptis chinensis TaxID=261450 RepID=A0A835GYE2_9MAGN|nr:hypothetical protein IFM89_028669 [Coptis chinensis]
MPKTPLLLLLILFLSTPSPTKAITLQQFRTLLSLTHSLMTRVANLRYSKGDYQGSKRAQNIADKLDGGLSLYKGMFSIGWDYLKNYAWRDMGSSIGMVRDMNRLLQALNELTQLESGKKRAEWVLRNYQSILVSSESVFRRLLQVFFKSGPLRDLVLMLQREAEGDLLRDCLELGSNDLNGVVQIFKDIFVQFSSGNQYGRSGDL